MSKLRWEYANQARRHAQAERHADATFSGVKPCTEKQSRLIEKLARKLGYQTIREFTREFQGASQTLSCRAASQAIDAAILRLGGHARKG